MYGNHKLIVVQLLSLIVQLTCTHCAIKKAVKCIHVWVQLCVKWVPTFKFDKVGKVIQKSILKQLCTHKRTNAKCILFMCNTKQQRCQLVPTYCTTVKKMYNRYLSSFCRRWAAPIRGFAFSFQSGSLCNTGFSIIVQLQKK
jgi:hypothetical protein